MTSGRIILKRGLRICVGEMNWFRTVLNDMVLNQVSWLMSRTRALLGTGDELGDRSIESVYLYCFIQMECRANSASPYISESGRLESEITFHLHPVSSHDFVIVRPS
jgi:hypothetical protein